MTEEQIFQASIKLTNKLLVRMRADIAEFVFGRQDLGEERPVEATTVMVLSALMDSLEDVAKKKKFK